MKCTFFCLMTFLLLSVRSPAWAATYYTAKTGSDSNDCTAAQSTSTPKLTIAGGLSCVFAGDTLYIRTGTYAEELKNTVITMRGGTSWLSPVTVSAYPTGNPATPYEAVTLRPSGTYSVIQIFGNVTKYIQFLGLDLDAVNVSHYVISLDGKNLAGAGFFRVKDSTLRNSNGSGVLTGGSSNDNEFINNIIRDNGKNPEGIPIKAYGLYLQTSRNLVERNQIFGHTGYGVHQYSGNGNAASGNRIIANIVHDNCTAITTAEAPGSEQSAGILIGMDDDNIAAYNIVYNEPFGIMAANGGATNTKIYNNTVYSVVHAPIIVKTGLRGLTEVRNNLLYDPTTPFNSGTPYTTNNGVRVDGDTVVTQTNNRTSDPGYLDAPGGNFALLSTSPAIDAGVAIAGYNYNGAAPDQGAHETISCGSAVVPAPGLGNNTMAITCTNNLRPPVRPAASCAGFTVRKNTVTNGITNCTRSGNNVFVLTLNDSYAAGNDADFTYATGSGTVTDFARIGGTQNQRLNAITTPIVATNNVSGSTPTVTQVACRFESSGGTESAPDSVWAIGAGLTLPPGRCGRVRCQASNTVAAIGETAFTFFVQKNGSGGYAQMLDGPTPSAGISFPTGTGWLPPELTDGPTTEKLAGAGAFIAGGVLLSAAEIPNITLGVGDDTELVAPFCVGSGNADAAYFDFRLYRTGGTALNAYTQTPRVTIDSTGYTAQMGAR